MMSKFFSCQCLVTAIGLATIVTSLVGPSFADQTIAWWKFDTADPWADSSGNGYSLLGFATSVADDCDGTGTESQGSAYFNGLDGWAVTNNTVDLTAYEAIRMSWWMKVDSTDLGILFEQSANYAVSPGGMIVAANESSGLGSACIFAKGAHTEAFSHEAAQQIWEQHTVEYWPTATSAAEVVKYYKNGVLQADAETIYPNTHGMGGQDSFIDDVFYFGARAGAQYFFEGNLDEVKLESFSPSSPLLSHPTEAPALVPLSNVLAQWTFDDAGNPWVDSSGNGNDLASAGDGVTQSSITLSGTGSSAYFDNSATAQLKTVNTLDLTPYRHVQMSWSQLVTSDEVDVLFEHGPAGAIGGILMGTQEVGSEGGYNGAVKIYNGVINDYNMPAYSHSHGSGNTTWDEMVLDINLDATTNDTVINVYRNGEWASTYYYENPYNLVPYGSVPETFIDAFFTLGGRDGVGSLNFTGHIDDFTITVDSIEDVPGDANRDGKVDGSDVTILAGNWQVGVGGVGGATWEMGDFNGDRAVDGSDVTILAGNWQHGVTANAASVPEPSVILLLWSAFGSLLVWKRMN